MVKLIITINIAEHNIFKRNNHNLIINLDISLMESLYGFRKNINHINGDTIWFQHLVDSNSSQNGIKQSSGTPRSYFNP